MSKRYIALFLCYFKNEIGNIYVYIHFLIQLYQNSVNNIKFKQNFYKNVIFSFMEY